MTCLALVALHSTGFANFSPPVAPVEQITALIPAVLKQSMHSTHVETFNIDYHCVMLIGERNHFDPKYRELSRLLHQMAVDRQLVFFKEALPRNAQIEQIWTEYRLNQPETGWFFGIENDLAYLISDWVAELGRFRLYGGERNKSQNDNFMIKFVLSAKAKPIWDIFLANATLEPLKQMAESLNPQIEALENRDPSDPLVIAPLTVDFPPAQWAIMHLALLQIASTSRDLSESARADLNELLKDPMNPNALVKFNESFGRVYRSQRMIENIKATLSTIPPEVPIVILVGEGHVEDVAKGLMSQTSKAARR